MCTVPKLRSYGAIGEDKEEEESVASEAEDAEGRDAVDML